MHNSVFASTQEVASLPSQSKTREGTTTFRDYFEQIVFDLDSFRSRFVQAGLNVGCQEPNKNLRTELEIC